ncbi:MAG: rhomboid family intramembrane serine protease [Sedimentisphaerales bacterium]|nr:rhomboid family intramembrane serine protease [Sedimentisphaerales bacterium]
MALEVVKKVIPRQAINTLWQRARASRQGDGKMCPACRRRMTEVPIVSGEKNEYLDVCTGCHFIWFDPREFEALPQSAAAKAPKARPMSDKEKEALALVHLKTVKKMQMDQEAHETYPENWIDVVGAYMGIPIEYNSMPLKHRPIVTVLLAGVIAIVSLATFRNLESAVTNWGLIPAELARHYGLTFVTSFFLHGGLIHLLGNLYYLILFGDNSEDVLGKGRYLLLIATASMVGDTAHILSDPSSTIPCVGASGGISGVMAYYCLRFPKASMGFVVFFHWICLPVGAMFALWVVLQITAFMMQPAGIANVAVFAHLGGAAVGVLFWWWDRCSLSTTS